MTCWTSSARWSKSRSSCWTSTTTAGATGCSKRSVTMRARSSNRTVNLAATAARHCEHYFAMAKQASDGMRGPEQAEWIQRIEADLDNVRSAIALALAGGVDPFIAVKIAVALQAFWMLRGYATEGRGIVRAALGAAGDPGVGPGPGLGAIRRRRAGRKPERPRRGAADAWNAAWCCGGGSETRSTSRPRCRPCLWPGCRAVMPEARARANARHCRFSGNSAIGAAKRWPAASRSDKCVPWRRCAGAYAP